MHGRRGRSMELPPRAAQAGSGPVVIIGSATIVLAGEPDGLRQGAGRRLLARIQRSTAQQTDVNRQQKA
jgi:hypothetical protein